MAVCYSLWSFGTFFPLWNVWIKKNLATLALTSLIFAFCFVLISSLGAPQIKYVKNVIRRTK
jgi:hypothetical protein